MLRSLYIATPFLVALIMFLIWLAYRAGKRKGMNEAPRRSNQVGSQLLRRADRMFHQLVVTTDLDRDDIITDKTRLDINIWRADYEKAKWM